MSILLAILKSFLEGPLDGTALINIRVLIPLNTLELNYLFVSNPGSLRLKYMGEEIQRLTGWLEFFLIIICSNISNQVFLKHFALVNIKSTLVDNY